MGKTTKSKQISYTLPPSPSHSFSSSSSPDFKFTISISPRNPSTAALCPADELFYKGQLLPLHPSPCISMVRTIPLSSSSSNNGGPRDSAGTSTDSQSSFNSDLALFPDSSRPSSATEDGEFKHLHNRNPQFNCQIKKSNKYFLLSRLSSVFRNENHKTCDSDKFDNVSGNSSVKRMSVTAIEVIGKYLKKVKPLFKKLSQKQQQQKGRRVGAVTENEKRLHSSTFSSLLAKMEKFTKETEFSAKNERKERWGVFSHSFSGNLRNLRRKRCVSSCPSSMRSSPSHSGVLSRSGFGSGGRIAGGMCYGDNSSMEELQSAIQSAIAHCKNSLLQN